jgi:hypothetical protein
MPDRQVLMENFSFPVYKEKWRKVLAGLGMIPVKAQTDIHSKQRNTAYLYPGL